MIKGTEKVFDKDLQVSYYSIEIPLYHQYVGLFTNQEYFSKFCKHIGLDFDEVNMAGIAIQGSTEEGHHCFYMFVPENSPFEVLAHESYHMTSMIMDLVGILHDPNNDEACAYLNGHIAGCVADAVADSEKETAKKLAAKKAKAPTRRVKKTPAKTAPKAKPKTPKKTKK